MDEGRQRLIKFVMDRLQEDWDLAQAVIDERPANGTPSGAAWAVSGLPEPARAYVLGNGPWKAQRTVEGLRTICYHAIGEGVSNEAREGSPDGRPPSLISYHAVRAISRRWADHEEFDERWSE